jgi:hypothetical protein
MHPEILRELTSQRGREMRDRAHRATLVRTARRARRRGLAEPDEFVVPAVPDFVDGSFRIQPADGEAARVPTTGRAA